MGFIIESIVAVLLVLTIGYCIVLNQRLKKLHADRDIMRAMIGDLMQATTMANGAIRELREVATETDATLNARLEEAERFGLELANHVNAGQAVLEKISKITSAARQSETIARVETRRAGMALEQLNIHEKRKGRAA
ncbi:hypothetical protein MNBD_ALPHA12-1461 [hydrothermal vent metagenome]|uniref:DUF6468 domain-containing protein n=1 Tax=hydrothermal vent metagenome TaxID=652676 RepID=A0A3B0UV74_9ZZZZ